MGPQRLLVHTINRTLFALEKLTFERVPLDMTVQVLFRFERTRTLRTQKVTLRLVDGGMTHQATLKVVRLEAARHFAAEPQLGSLRSSRPFGPLLQVVHLDVTRQLQTQPKRGRTA
jgi:hypothetical protein